MDRNVSAHAPIESSADEPVVSTAASASGAKVDPPLSLRTTVEAVIRLASTNPEHVGRQDVPDLLAGIRGHAQEALRLMESPLAGRASATSQSVSPRMPWTTADDRVVDILCKKLRGIVCMEVAENLQRTHFPDVTPFENCSRMRMRIADYLRQRKDLPNQGVELVRDGTAFDAHVLRLFNKDRAGGVLLYRRLGPDLYLNVYEASSGIGHPDLTVDETMDGPEEIMCSVGDDLREVANLVYHQLERLGRQGKPLDQILQPAR